MRRVRKIVHIKLGRKKRWAESGGDTIYIDPRCKGRKHMEMAHHESLHVLFPDLPEETIIAAAKELTLVLWELDYRRIDNDKSQPLQRLKDR